MRKILGLLMAVSLLVGFGCQQSGGPTGNVVGEATLIIDSGTGSPQSVELEVREGTTVLGLLEEAASELDLSLDYDGHTWSDLGIWIEGIGGVKSNKIEGRYWLYYVNGETASLAVDRQEVKEEDAVEFRYEKVL